MRREAIYLCSALLVFLGCSNGSNQGAVRAPDAIRLNGPPKIDSASEEGFSDCIFYFDLVQGEGNNLSLSPEATSKGKRVGFTIQFDRDWKSQSHSAGDATLEVKTGSVTFHRSGPESDDFVTTLATAYGKQAPGKKMAENVRFDAVCLKGDPGTLGLAPASIKLFINSEDQAKYGEFFLDIDFTHHSIRINEKDPEYREAILKALTNQAK